MTKQDKINLIRDKNCNKCPLHESAYKICCLGRGNVDADIFFIGESPGQRGTDIGKPLDGDSGLLFDDIINALGLTRDDVYISNAVQCTVYDNKKINKKAIDKCRDYLFNELESVRPKVIVPLGNNALNSLLKKSGITKHRGNTYKYKGNGWTANVMPTFHPAAILRKPGDMGLLVDDLSRVVDELNGRNKKEVIRYRLADSIDKIKFYIEKIKKYGVVSFDTETNGTKPHRRNFKVATIQFSYKKRHGVVIPISHELSPFTKPQLKIISKLLEKEIFNNKNVIKVAQNAKFDLRVLKRIGIKKFKGEYHDTMILHYLENENRRHDLDSMSFELTMYGEYWRKVHELGLLDGKALEIPIKILGKYGAKDTDVTLRAFKKLLKSIKKDKELYRIYRNIYMASLLSFTEMEDNGMVLDRKYNKKLSKKFEKAIDELREKLLSYRQTKRAEKVIRSLKEEGVSLRDGSTTKPNKKYESLNLGSTDQLKFVLYKFMLSENKQKFNCGFGFKPIKYTETGAPSCSEESIIELMNNPNSDDLTRDFMVNLVEYKKLTTLDSKYASGMQKHLMGKDDYVHPNYKIIGTVTGRPSCTEPNLLNIPRSKLAEYDSPLKPLIKKQFIAPEGFVIVQVDYSQAELRVMADWAGDDRMIGWFRDGKDVHLFVAADMLGIPESEVTDGQRKRAKTVNFGVIYCVGKYTLADNLSSPSQGVFYTPDQAEKFQIDYFNRFPKIKIQMDYFQNFAKENGFVRTRFGQKRRLPDLMSNNSYLIREALNQSVNAPIQGTAAQYTICAINMAMGNFHFNKSPIKKIDKRIKINNTVYDSIMAYVPENRVQDYSYEMKKICENVPTKKYFDFESKVPMKVDVEWGYNWSDLKSVKL